MGRIIQPLTLIVVAVFGYSGDPEALKAADEGYNNGGILGVFAATTPEALAERKRKAALRAAYRAKVCTSVAAAGTPAHEGCVLQMAEEDALKEKAAQAMQSVSGPVTCHRIGNSVMCD